MTSKKTLCLIAAIVMGISVFFPYLSMSFFGATLSKSLIDGGDGYIILAIAIIAIICIIFEKYIPAAIMGFVGIALFFFENQNVSKNLANNSAKDLARALLQNGFGYYALLFGSLALIGLSIFCILDKRKS